MCAMVLGLCLSPAAYALAPPEEPALDRNRCLAGGYWYGFYRDKSLLTPICLKLPAAISGKILDSNGDGVVDNIDAISSGVVYIGDNPPRSDTDDGMPAVGHEAGGDIMPSGDDSGGSRRIMWRQIQ